MSLWGSVIKGPLASISLSLSPSSFLSVSDHTLWGKPAAMSREAPWRGTGGEEPKPAANLFKSHSFFIRLDNHTFLLSHCGV